MPRIAKGVRVGRLLLVLAVPALASLAAACPTPFRPDILSLLHDSVAPVVTFSSPIPGSAFESAAVISGAIVDYDDEGNARTGAAAEYIASATYRLLGSVGAAEAVGLADDGTFSIRLATASYRVQITIVVEATDRNGNSGSAAITLIPDAEGPFLALISPEDYSDYASLVTLSGYARNSSADWAISELEPSVAYKMPGTDIHGSLALDSAGSFSGTLDVSDLSGARSIEVTATDLNGNSATLIVTIQKPDGGGDISGFTVQPGNKSVTVSWSPVEGAASYTLFESEYRLSVEGLGDDDVPYVWSGLGNGIRYSFTLTAVFDDAELNARSVAIEAIPLSPRTLAPTVTETGYGYVSLGWEGFYDIPRYTLEKRELPSGEFSILTKTTATEYYDDDVDPGVWYEYRVAPSSDQDAVSDYVTGTPGRFLNAPYEPITSYNGEGIMDIEEAGGMLYDLKNTGKVRVLDTSNPAAPATVRTYTAPSAGARLTISGTDAIVAATSWLYVIDLTNPDTSAYKGRYYEWNLAMQGVAVSGGYAFVAAGDAGLAVFDLSSGGNPTKVNTLNTAGSAKAVAIRGRYAYVADGDSGFAVVDINSPTSPVQVYTYDNGTANDVALSADGKYMYLAAGTGGVMLYDITAPTLPVYKGTYDTPGSANGVSVAGTCAYVADYDAGLYVIDFHVPNAPRLIRSYGFVYANQTETAGDYVYVAAQNSGLKAIRLPTPTGLSIEGSCDTPGNDYDVDVAGEYAYVADGTLGLTVIDVSDPEAPTIAAACDIPGAAMRLEVAGDYAYLADDARTITIIDVSTPTSPRIAGSLGTGQAIDLAVSGEYAYVGASSGLLVIDISDSSAPNVIGSWPTTSPVQGIALSGTYAYLVTMFEGLLVLDVSDPARPARVSVIDTADCSYDIVLANGYAFVADRYSGLVVIDVSNPASPSLATTVVYTASPYARGLAVSGDYVYVADLISGLFCLDISSPAAPVVVGSYAQSNFMRAKVAGRFAYIARSSGDMTIVDLREE